MIEMRINQLRDEIYKRLDGFDPGQWFNLQTEINLCIEMEWPEDEATARKSFNALCEGISPIVLNACYAYFFLQEADAGKSYDALVSAYRCLLGGGEKEMSSFHGHKGGRPKYWFSDDINALIKEKLEGMPLTTTDKAEYVFTNLKGAGCGAISEIEMSGNDTTLIINPVSTTENPLLKMFERNMQTSNERPSGYQTRRQIKDRITAINKGKDD